MNKIINDRKKYAAKLSILSNSLLIILKFIAGALSGSIGIISEAIHSSSDLLASVMTFFSVSESSKPADKDHPFGHDKYEDFTSLLEGILIILAAIFIIYEATKKLIHAESVYMDVNVGLGVMLASVIANIFISAYLFKVAKETNSSALYADGEHLRTDVYSSFAVFLGLLFVKITGNVIYDPIIAILVAIIIFIAGYKICEKAKNHLLDVSLEESEEEQIHEIIKGYNHNNIISLKSLRTRKSGMKKIIEITLIAEKTLTIETAHGMCDEIEDKIEAVLCNTDITIHLEPNV